VVEEGVAYLSGQISKISDEILVQGSVDSDVDLETAIYAARLAATNVLALLYHRLGIEQVRRVLRVVGYVQADPSFKKIPQVINGASELFHSVLGEEGKHSRSAVGVISLPLNMTVELEVTVALM